MIDVKEFVKERNEALFSFDREKITSYLSKYGTPVPVPDNDDVFWGSVAKAVMSITSAPEDARQKAKKHPGQVGLELHHLVEEVAKR